MRHRPPTIPRIRLRVMAKDADRRARMRLVLNTVFTLDLVETDTFDCVVVIEELEQKPVVHVMSGEMSYSQVFDLSDMRGVRRGVISACQRLPEYRRKLLCRS